MQRCLAIRVFAQSQLGPIDFVAARIAADQWTPPKEGDELPLPDGRTVPWQNVPRENGVFKHETLPGGYASLLVDSPIEQIVMMRILSPHMGCYVNRRPRVGDVYAHGHVLLPVFLQEGANEVLVHCRSDSLGIAFESPGSATPINSADPTVPDLIVGQATDALAAVTIGNASNAQLAGLTMQVSGDGIDTTSSDLPVIAPLTVRKVPFRIQGPPPRASGKVTVTLKITRSSDEGEALQGRAQLELDVRPVGAPHRRTFLSDIDGSVQYYAVTPGNLAPEARDQPALFLTLHGAGVEALGQAQSYAPKSWGHIVAPTNRGRFGFDWEDWGRLDALEVLADAQRQLGTDPRRTYLTGHSMGGHGTWHVGATYPDRFAAIGPSAGWISFSTYGARNQKPADHAVVELRRRAASPSETLTLARNHQQHGVYVLHGASDDNVPVDQARQIRQKLSEFHRDVSFHEQPNAGHWWDASDEPGVDCVDWAPMFELFARRIIPSPESVRDVDFTTANPGISATCQWCTILTQRKNLQPATVKVRNDPGLRRFVGTTENVERLAFDVRHLAPPGPLTVTLDGQTIAEIPWPDDRMLVLQRELDQWQVRTSPPARDKGPRRYGPFKDAFRNRMLLVYGTRGDELEQQATYDKARLDAETFWYRGNGSVQLIPDHQFAPDAEPDRNVILYGNSQSNSAWDALLADCPIQIKRGELKVGERVLARDDLACLMIRPRAGSDRASVGVVGATGAAGMRKAAQIHYFHSRIALPDWEIFGSVKELPGHAFELGMGFFGVDWTLERGESAWR